MNRIYNSWIFIVSVITLLYAFLVMLYEEFGIFVKAHVLAGSQKEIIYIATAGLVFLIGGWRASRRWSGIRIVRQTSRFKLSFPISAARKKHVFINNVIEIIAYFLFGFAFFRFDADSFLISLVFLFLLLDALFNTFWGIKQNKYSLGITKKAIILVDREVKAIYFKGLKRITKQKSTLYFEYINDLVLDLPLNTIAPEHQEELFRFLQENTDKSRVYFSGFEENEATR